MIARILTMCSIDLIDCISGGSPAIIGGIGYAGAAMELRAPLSTPPLKTLVQSEWGGSEPDSSGKPVFRWPASPIPPVPNGLK